MNCKQDDYGVENLLDGGSGSNRVCDFQMYALMY